MPGHCPDEILNFAFVCGIIRRAKSSDVDGPALGRDFYPHQRRTRRRLSVLRHRYEGGVDRFRPVVEAGAIGVVASARDALRICRPVRAGRGNRRPDLRELRRELLNLTRPDHDCIRVEIVARSRDGEGVGARREAGQRLGDRLLVDQDSRPTRKPYQTYASTVDRNCRSRRVGRLCRWPDDHGR